ENLLAYNKLIGNHQFDIVTGLTYQKSKYENLNSGMALGFISDIYENNNLGSASTKAQPSTGYSDNSLLSYLSRINYNFDSKYFLTLTGRYDGSSRFGHDNRFAFFPSGSLAWRVSQEDFL